MVLDVPSVAAMTIFLSVEFVMFAGTCPLGRNLINVSEIQDK